jgi:glutamyl-tRNA synthetase
MGPLRVALTGWADSPGVFEIMEILGREEVLSRIDKAIHICSGSTVQGFNGSRV